MRFDVKRERKNNGSDLQVVTVDRSNKMKLMEHFQGLDQRK